MLPDWRATGPPVESSRIPLTAAQPVLSVSTEAGRVADLSVIAPGTYRDRSAMMDPHHVSDGVIHVLVNGAYAIRDEEATGVMPGEPLRAPWRHEGS